MTGKMGEKVQEPEVKMEDVLESIGGFGYFQKVFAFLAIFPQMAAAMIILSPVFTGTENVPIFCRVDNDTDLYQDFSCDVNCTEPTGEEVYVSIVQEWELVCSKSWIVDAITSCQMAGMMLGALLSSIVADNFGRTKGYMFITLGMGIFGLLPAATFSPVTYAITRFLAGFGMGGCFVVYLVHLMEFLTPSWRTICGCVSLWPIGEMLLGLIAYLVPDWRYLTLITAAPTFLVLLLFPYIQESPRWLLTQKRTRDAHNVLRKIAYWNSRAPPQVATVEALQATVLREQENVLKGFECVKQIIRNQRLRTDLMILTWANIACAIVYYGVSFSAKSLSGDVHLNMLYMGILDFVGIPAALIFTNRLGRKRTFILYMTAASTSLVAILILMFCGGDLMTRYPVAVTILALGGRLGVVASWGALSCIMLETFPTTLRSTCLGFTACAGYLGGIAAPQTVFLGNISASIPYILYCFLTVTTCIFSWFLNEMAGKPLNDTAKTGA